MNNKNPKKKNSFQKLYNNLKRKIWLSHPTQITEAQSDFFQISFHIQDTIIISIYIYVCTREIWWILFNGIKLRIVRQYWTIEDKRPTHD